MALRPTSISESFAKALPSLDDFVPAKLLIVKDSELSPL